MGGGGKTGTPMRSSNLSITDLLDFATSAFETRRKT